MTEIINPGRRRALGFTGAGMLSAAAVGILANVPQSAFAAQKGHQKGHHAPANTAAADVSILNVALGLEHEAIEAYQIGAESGLLQPAVVQVAVGFQSHHKAHRDALVGAIRSMGGTPVAAKSRADYVAGLNAASLRSQVDVLKLAQRLERGAANAYIGVIPSFKDPALAKISARLAADETMHWTALTQALGESLPVGALTFGA